MVLAEPVEITRRITRVLEDLEIPYFVGGSLASSLHGIPRATQDVDIVADVKSEHVPSLANALETDFYVDAQMIVDQTIDDGVQAAMLEVDIKRSLLDTRQDIRQFTRERIQEPCPIAVGASEPL